ncbi:MAG: glycosyltransferase family 1 protein, partial [Planctomycetia bacterium]|nr:glycosyltransferase family 1 protein [Planctomycetia bacterium]
MPRRYLFGPVTRAFAEQHLRHSREVGECLAFNAAGDLDLTVGPSDTWESITRQFPAGWQPDFAALYLPYTSIPPGLWFAPVPLVGLACDWNLLWHGYRHQLGSCEMILTDAAGVAACQRQGLAHARAANLYGCEQAYLDFAWPSGPRDLDVLFVGNLNAAVQGERLAWLGRLARLREHWQVAIHTGVFGDDYRRLLGRTRIVFNRSIRGECNRRVFEAVAAGTLLFSEAGNREVPDYLRAGQEYVEYTDANL